MGWLSKAWKGLRKLSNFLGLGIPNLIEKTLKKWLTPKIPDKEALKVPRQGSDQFIPVVYGTREVGAIVVDRNVTDQSGGADNEFLHVMCVFCYGEIDGFEELYFGDVSWNDKRWLKDKNNPNGAKWFTYELRTGAAGQSAANAVGKLNSFSSENSKYEGLAVAFFTFQQDKDQSIWQGEPQIKARIRGKKCLDPRTGVTAYTENPAIHLVDYLSNNIYSLGLTSEDYDIQSFINVANISDIEHTATIDTRVCKTEEGVYSCTGTPAEVVTFKRYSHNNIIDTQQSIFDNIQEIANCFRGYFPNSDGRLSVASEMEAGSVFSFNEDNMVSSITSEVPDRNSRFNRVIVRFPNKANNYEKDECVFPDADSQTEIDWLAEDNGTTQEKVLTVEYTVYKAEALQLARIAAYVSRYADTITFTATPEANILDVGDVIDVTDSTRGWDAKPFRMSDIQYRDDGLVNITGVQHENAVYPWLGMSYTDIIGGSNLGDPSNIAAPFGLTITPDETFATAGLLSWESVNDAFIRRFTVTVLSGEDVVYRTESLANNWPIPLLDAGDYSIQVRAVSTIGSLSPEAVIALTLTAPVAPTDIIFNASNFEIEARPVLLGQGIGTTFEFAIDSESPIRGKGQTIVFTGLNFGTEYTVFARTVNALGVSAWFSKSVSTTADSGPIIDLVGNDMYNSIFEPVVIDLQAQIDEALESSGVANIGVNDLNLRISNEVVSRKETDKALFDTAASAVQLRQDLANGMSGLTDAVFEVDPSTGTINLKAYSYTDNAFSQAGVLIDGVAAEVEIQSERVTETEGRITNAESNILVQAGVISLKASYTEVNEIVAGAIDAVLPAYSFGFFNSSEGWTAVNGTLTQGVSKLNLTLGDIQNQVLSYSADENPIISITVERTGGSGWIGDLVVTFSGGSTQTYSNVIANVDVGSPMVRLLNLGGEATYTGTVTGIRFKFGATVADTFTLSSVTIGKPSATLEALDGITAQVNQLGIDIDAVEGSLTNYVNTAFYEENTVTFNNLDVTLDGTNAVISLKATQQEISANNVITKANEAAIWIDASEANITQVVQSYNAQVGGIDDQLGDVGDQFTIVQSEIDAVTGKVTDQILSIHRLGNKDGDIEKNAFYAAEMQIRQKRGLLELGESIALADRTIQALSDETGALSQEFLLLKASTGSEFGQVNAQITSLSRVVSSNESATASYVNKLTADIDGNYSAQSTLIQQVNSRVDGTSDALASLDTKVTGIDGELSSAQLTLSSTVDELGNIASRAFLGTTSVVAGVATVNGIIVDGATNALEFKTDTLRLTDTTGNLKLYWDSVNNAFVFNGRLVVGGYAVNSEADIRALDGDTIYEIHQYSVDGATNWHTTYTTGDLFRRTATVTNGATGAWSAAARITGLTGDQGPQGVPGATGANGVTTYTWIKYADSATGAGLSNDPTGKKYIGFAYNKTTATESNTASDYTWSLIQGPQGNTGVAGATGADGQTTYTWIKYANVADGTGLYDTPTSATKYIGIAVNKTTATESTVKTDYTWSQFKGDDGSDGATGATGAGFYGSTYAAISWTTSTANSRFLALVGRNPVNLDIFTQTRQDGTDSQARQYNGASWAAVALQINGSIVASGTIAGDRLVAGIEISAPVISGGTIKLIGTNFMEYWSATPFGADQLIEWYGEKVNGINWNPTTGQTIPSGMLKSNAKTYKDANGGVFFGGTFQAGTLSSSQTSTQLISAPSTSVVFGSNGGIITIAASYSFGTRKRGNVTGTPNETAICPTSPILSVVTGTLYLERKNGGNWVIVKQQAISGAYSCTDGEYVGQAGNLPYTAVSNSGSVFTYTDNLGTATNREYRVRALLNNFYYTDTTSQSISIATSE